MPLVSPDAMQESHRENATVYERRRHRIARVARRHSAAPGNLVTPLDFCGDDCRNLATPARLRMRQMPADASFKGGIVRHHMPSMPARVHGSVHLGDCGACSWISGQDHRGQRSRRPCTHVSHVAQQESIRYGDTGCSTTLTKCARQSRSLCKQRFPRPCERRAAKPKDANSFDAMRTISHVSRPSHLHRAGTASVKTREVMGAGVVARIRSAACGPADLPGPSGSRLASGPTNTSVHRRRRTFPNCRRAERTANRP